MRPEWVFEGYAVSEPWIVMLGVAHDYEADADRARGDRRAAEVIRQYARGNQAGQGGGRRHPRAQGHAPRRMAGRWPGRWC